MQIRKGKEVVRGFLAAMNEFMSIELDGLHPRLLKMLADMFSELLNVILEKS